jgi:urease accessory protein
MKRTIILAGAATALAVLAGPALAHTGVGHADGFAAGLAHPMLGLDHLLAMTSVGIWSALAIPGRAWVGPLAFVSAMIAGAAIAFLGIALPGVESMIAASVVALGLMIVAGARLPMLAGVALCGLFALFHGHAHASEATGAVLAYVGGFSVATAAIHVAGIGIGRGIVRSSWLRYAIGVVVAGAGAAFVLGA